jgi:hypothetical protein
MQVALHYVFNAPEDKIIWDVGHQAYVHKILTGRRSRMNTIRTTGGLSGVPPATQKGRTACRKGSTAEQASHEAGMYSHLSSWLQSACRVRGYMCLRTVQGSPSGRRASMTPLEQATAPPASAQAWEWQWAEISKAKRTR